MCFARTHDDPVGLEPVQKLRTESRRSRRGEGETRRAENTGRIRAMSNDAIADGSDVGRRERFLDRLSVQRRASSCQPRGPVTPMAALLIRCVEGLCVILAPCPRRDVTPEMVAYWRGAVLGNAKRCGSVGGGRTAQVGDVPRGTQRLMPGRCLVRCSRWNISDTPGRDPMWIATFRKNDHR